MFVSSHFVCFSSNSFNKFNRTTSLCCCWFVAELSMSPFSMTGPTQPINRVTTQPDLTHCKLKNLDQTQSNVRNH